jgi:hypothetical protein
MTYSAATGVEADDQKMNIGEWLSTGCWAGVRAVAKETAALGTTMMQAPQLAACNCRCMANHSQESKKTAGYVTGSMHTQQAAGIISKAIFATHNFGWRSVSKPGLSVRARTAVTTET